MPSRVKPLFPGDVVYVHVFRQSLVFLNNPGLVVQTERAGVVYPFDWNGFLFAVKRKL